MVDQCKATVNCEERCGGKKKTCAGVSCGECQTCVETSTGIACVRDPSCDDPPTPPGVYCGRGVTCQGGCTFCRTVCVGDWCHGTTGGCVTLGPDESCPPTSCPTHIPADESVCGVGHYHGTVCGIGTLSCGGSGRGDSKPCCGGGSGKARGVGGGLFSRMVMAHEEDLGVLYPGDPDFPYSMFRDKDWSEFSNEVPHFYEAKKSGWSLLYEDTYQEDDYDPNWKHEPEE